jgi:hypothetical protein
MIATPVLPHPFKPLSSFLAYAVGDEKIELKPEWQRVFAPSGRAVESRKAA